MKVNDDNVKIYHTGQKISNLILYQQINGAPFQLSWGNHASVESTVDGVEIVACYVPMDGKPGNADLVNLRHHGQNKVIRNLVFRNITADQGVYRIIGINNDNGGILKNILLENITLKKAPVEPGFIYLTKGGSIENITIKNLVVKGKSYQSSDFEITGVDKSVLTIK